MARKNSGDEVNLTITGTEAGAKRLLQDMIRQVKLLEEAQRAENQAAKDRAAILKQMQADEAKASSQSAKLRRAAQQEQARLAAQLVADRNKEVAAIERAARAEQKASDAKTKADKAAQTSAQRTANQIAAANKASAQSVASLTREVIALAGAFIGLRTIDAYIQRGLQFNQLIETSTLGIATLIIAEGKLTDQQGHLLTGTTALVAAQGLARNEINKLRIAGIQTAATTEQLVVAFQEAVGAGIKTGLSLEQIRNFTVQISQAALAIGLPFNQLNQEVRSILNGTIDRNSRIAKALQLTNQEIRQAKEQNRLAELLTERFQAFTIAGQESLNTMAALKSNIQDALDLFAGEQVKPLFEQFSRAGREALASVFDLHAARIQDNFRGFIQTGQDAFREIGRVLADGIKAGLQQGATLSNFLKENRTGFNALAQEVGFTARQFGEIVSAVEGLGSSLVKAGVAGAAVRTTLNAVGGAARLIADNIELIGVVVGGFAARGLFYAAMANPITAAVVASVTLLSLLRSISLEQERMHQAQLSDLERRREEGKQIIQLAAQYRAYAQIVRDSKVHGEALSAQQSLADVTKQLLELQPGLRNFIGSMGDASQAAVDALDRSIQASNHGVLRDLQQSRQALAEAKDALRKASEDQAKLDAGNAVGPGVDQARRAAKASTDKALEQVQSLQNRVDLLTATAQDFLDAMQRGGLETQGILANLTPRAGETPTGAGAAAALNDPVERARGNLDQVKREAEAGQAQLKAFYDAGAINAQRYYEGILAFDNKVIDAEQNLHSAELLVGRNKHDQGLIDKAKADLAGINAEREHATIQSNEGIRKADEELQNTRIKIAQDTAAALGDEATIAGAEVGTKYADALIIAMREGDIKLTNDILALIDTLTRKNRLKQLDEQEQALDATFRDRIARIENLQKTASITTLEAQKQTTAAYRDQIAALNVLLAQKQALHLTDAQSVRDIQVLQTNIDNLTTEMKLLSDTSTQLAVAIQNGLEEGFTNTLAAIFGDLETGAHKTKDAIKDMASSILTDINRIIARTLALQAIQAIGSFVANAILPSDFGKGFATGGHVVGPGGPTADQVPAMLSNGEFVVNAKSASAFRSELEAINSFGLRGRRRFAAGGAVESTGGARATAAPWEARLAVSLGPDLVANGIESDKGQRSTLRVLQQNKQSIRRMLGIA